MNGINYDRIPEHMKEYMRKYIEKGEPMGGFLTAVFANDFKNVVARADDTNIQILREYASWVYWEVPQGCHGSYEIVEEWIKKKNRKNGKS